MLSDPQWELLCRVMLHSGHVYNKTKHRMTFEGILYRMRTGCPWRDLPEEFGRWNTVFKRFNRLGEIRDRSFEQQRYRASGLNLVTAAIVLWNTVYLERAANALRGHGQAVDDAQLQYLSPLGWEHINLTGDYLWRSSAKIGAGKFRPLRPLQPA
ncbi:TPA: Tn3 family transposase [Escherichia coli]